MKKLALVILGSVFVSCCVHADTISVPSGTTYQLDATTDYSSSTFDLSGGTLDLNGRTASAAGLTFSGTGTSTFTNSGDTATMTYAGNFVVGSTAEGRTVRFTGGKHYFKSGRVYLSNDDTTGQSLTFEMSGADTEITVNQNATGYFGNYSDLTMNFLGGKLLLNNNQGAYVAVNEGRVAMNFKGGSFKTIAQWLCYRSQVDINIEDGTFEPNKLLIGGYKDGTHKKQTLTMTGGACHDQIVGL